MDRTFVPLQENYSEAAYYRPFQRIQTKTRSAQFRVKNESGI